MDESAHIFDRYLSGRESAAEELFSRYLDRLTRLARSRLSEKLAGRVDAEDVVMSAYRSFFIGARDGEFVIKRSGDLWALLARITLNKLFRTAARHTARKRDVANEVDLQVEASASEPSVLEAIALADELEAFMATLPNNSRRMLELRLQGATIDEVAIDVGVNERTVRRTLGRMRDALTELAGVSGHRPFGDSSERAEPEPSPRRRIPTPPDGNQDYTDYVLEKQIGIGGMGRVYRAYRKSDGHVFAVKYLRKSFLSQPAAVERFVREATTVSELSHPNIVPVEGFGRTDGGGFFIVMQLADGSDLATRCRDEMPSSQQIAHWLLPIADALTYAHASGVVHCDLKPANILIANDVPMLTDFGLSRRVGERINASEFSGTVPFMAPEQIDASLGTIGPHTDVYGLAASLFYLLTGRPPFVGDRVVDVMAAIVTSNEPPLPSVFGGAEEFDDLCLRTLTSAKDRVQTASEFVDRLRELLR